MNKKYKKIEELYRDNLTCAEEFGIEYCEETVDWYLRKGNKENFSYTQADGQKISSQKILKYIEELVIPPMWSNTEISPNLKNHILAFGYDAKGRKQYIYNEKWSEARSLVNSYKLILFGEALGKIRSQYKKLIKYEIGTREYALGLFLLLLDTTVIRVGNKYYFDENNTVGLATLQTKNIIKKGRSVYLQFTGKSGKEHEILIRHKKLKQELIGLKNEKIGSLFEYTHNSEIHTLTPSAVNSYIQETAKIDIISAKDFRTWHASRIVFGDMIEHLSPELPDIKRKKILLSSFDNAAEKLGNSRTMVRESYVHSDLIESVEEKTFLQRYNLVKTRYKKIRNLTKRESEFLECLKLLYDENSEI